MNSLKRGLGILWMIIGPVAVLLLSKSALQNIAVAGKGDINKPLPWLIIISVFTPIGVGLVLFGWYAWKGEYDDKVKT